MEVLSVVVLGQITNNAPRCAERVVWHQSSRSEETPGTGRLNGDAVSVSAYSTVVSKVWMTDRSKDSNAEKTAGIAIDRIRRKTPNPIEERIRICV